jgi:outer membrane receptor protein involved in Fe transport
MQPYRLTPLLAIALAVAAFGQLTRGFISGTVQDASGAVIQGVKITFTHVETNTKREVETNDLGVYRLVAVEPGTYSAEFSKQGFELRKVENIAVDANQEVVLNQSLAIGPTQTIVEVAETPPGVVLAKSTPTVSQTLEQRMITQLPTTGNRDVTRLVLVAPTVTRAPGSNEFSANGQRARNNNFMIDGVDNNDPSVTLPNQRIVPEAVDQFQVLTNAYSAEFGRNSGAQVLVTTRRGTNDFHGEVYDFYRANWLEPVSLLNKGAGLTETPRFVHNQAGASVGGPIVKDRLFVHGFLEANRRREAPDARNASSITIPTAQGYAALSSLPLHPEQTAASRQAAMQSLAFLPEVHTLLGGNYTQTRNVTINGVPIQVGTARIPLANPNNFWIVQPRVDYHLTNSDLLTYRLQLDKRDQPDFISNLGFGQRWSGAQTILGQNHMLSHTRSFSPSLTNEFRFGYARRNLDFPENDPNSPTVGITGYFTIGGSSNFPQGRISNTFQFQDIATLLRGRHSLKFGVDIRRNRLFNRSGFDSKGTWTFNNLEDFVNSRPFRLLQAVNEATFDARQTNQFYFVQDDIKVTKDLTLNLGLRYEYSDVPFGFFGATDPLSLGAGVPGPVRADKNNWAPRFGFAYSPSQPGGFLGTLLGQGQTVFRGGYGVTYDVLFFNIATVTASNYPRVVVDQKNQNELINVYPTRPPQQTTAPTFNPLATWAVAPEDTQAPTTHFWSFSIQRQFAREFVAEIGYSGNRSYHGIRQGQLNPAVLTPAQAQRVLQSGNPNDAGPLQSRRLNPEWGSRVTIEATAKANYNAMFLRLDKRFSSGLAFGGSYTWSKAMSDNDESLAVADIVNSSPPVPQDYLNYRPDWSLSAFDRPHRFVVHYNYEIPWFASGTAAHPVLRHVLGGWQVAGFWEYQSGQPFTIRTGVDSGGNGDARPHRPNLNPGGTMAADADTGDFRTFRVPLDGTGIVVAPLTASGVPLVNSMPGGGNLGRNTFRGPSFTNWNFNVSKNINITERWRIQLRSDWVNFLNHRNFGNPVSTMNSPNFGQNTTDPGGRTGLLGLKIFF